VRLVHLAGGSVKTVVEKPEADIENVALARSGVGPSASHDDLGVVFVRTAESAEAYRAMNGDLLATLPLSPSEKAARRLGLCRTEPGGFVLVAAKGGARIDGTTVRWVNGSGETVDHVELHEPQGRSDRPTHLRSVARGMLLPLPYLVCKSRTTRDARFFGLTSETLAVAMLVGALCALTIGLDARRSFVSVPGTIVWCIFALTCGAAALLSYFTTESRPGLERCHACGRTKPLSAPTCPRCHASVQSPSPKGIEIFA
jgi:hypothetical protein